jgi:RNA polymerase II subunit A small phosphatase-like protein
MSDVGAQRKLLILDLDETLLYATEEPLSIKEDFKVERYYIYLRPHVDRFLAFCLTKFEVAVWTTSTEDYAEEIVSRFFPSREAISFLWARNRCTRKYDGELQEFYWIKNLQKVKRKGYDLEQVIVIDDTAQKHEQNYGNLIPVREFTGDPNDNELLLLESYLEKIADTPNFRRLEKRSWRTEVNMP